MRGDLTLIIASVLASAAFAAAQCGVPTFQLTETSAVGTKPNGAVTADFNGDGWPDAAVTNDAGASVTVLLGNAGAPGVFAPGVSYAVGANPNDPVAGDFDNDGFLDIAVANYNSGSVSVLRGNGDGTFKDAVNSPAGSHPLRIAAADFDGDGWLDLVVGNDSPVSRLTNKADGTGTFENPATIAFDIYAQASVAAPDLNGDGHADVLVTSRYCCGGRTCVRLNNGDGSFGPAVYYGSEGYFGYSVVAVDLNGDGVLDVGYGGDNNRITIFLGTGGGVLSAPSYIGFVSTIYGLRASDMNGDNIVDLVATGSNLNKVLVARGVGDGTFHEPDLLDLITQPRGLAVGDFDLDGRVDILATNYANGFNSTSLLRNSSRHPEITLQPDDANTCANAATFEIAATAPPSGGTITYQWRRDGQDIFGATGTTLTISPVTLDDLAALFDCVVANNCGHSVSVSAGINAACAADFNCDGNLNLFDFLAFQTAFGNADPAADFNGDGNLNLFDFLAFQTAFGGGC